MNYGMHLISHGKDVQEILTDRDGRTADHVMSATAFTYHAVLPTGEHAAAHRIGYIIVVDPTTAHDAAMSLQAVPVVINKLIDSFRDSLLAVFGEEGLRDAMLMGLRDMVSHLPEDDGPSHDKFPLN